MFAVFLSTSDEMLPIFLAEQVPIDTVVKVMGAKVIIGMVMGFIVDAALRLIRRDRQNLRIHELCARDKCHCGGDCATCEENPALVYEHHDDCGSCCTHEHHEHDHGHDHDHGWKGIAKKARSSTRRRSRCSSSSSRSSSTACSKRWGRLAAFVGSNSVLAVFASALVGPSFPTARRAWS